MTDLDQLARTVKDLEYRVRALEKAREPRSQPRWTSCSACGGTGYKMAWGNQTSAAASVCERCFGVGKVTASSQFCSCGRDVCRAPDCPSHKPDPMGR